MFVEHGAEITRHSLYMTDGADDDDACFEFLESHASQSVLESCDDRVFQELFANSKLGRERQASLQHSNSQ